MALNQEALMNRSVMWLGVVLGLTLTACQSAPLLIPSAPLGPNEQRLGVGEGV